FFQRLFTDEPATSASSVRSGSRFSITAKRCSRSLRAPRESGGSQFEGQAASSLAIAARLGAAPARGRLDPRPPWLPPQSGSYSVPVPKLVSTLIRWHNGEKKVWADMRGPTAVDEDQRQLHRDLIDLKAELREGSNRIKGLLAGLGNSSAGRDTRQCRTFSR